jgi:hypothetical protein
MVFCLYLLSLPLHGENLRVSVAGTLNISPAGREEAISLSYIDSALIRLGQDLRFLKGVELELTAPQSYLAHRGSLAVALYADLDKPPEPGVSDLQGRQISFEPMPNKIQIIYQIPLRAGHGLRTTPYVSLLTDIIPPESFPVLIRIMPVIKGLSDEVEAMRFRLTAKPIFSDEGAIKIIARYPEQLPGKPFTVYIDGEVIEKPQEERILREGEHQLLILSNDYRREDRRFLVERGKILDLTIDLQDATPLVFFEAPEDSRIFFDGIPLENIRKPHPAEPGLHEVKFQVSDYSIVRAIQLQKGKNYKIALSVDLTISENE